MCIYKSILHSVPTEVEKLQCLLDCLLACPPGLLGLPGPLYCLPGPQYCLSWPSGRQLDANWTPIGRQVSAKLGCHNGCKFQRTP